MKRTLITAALFCGLLGGAGCRKEAHYQPSQDMQPLGMEAELPVAADGEPMVLGAQKPNPYTLQAMQASLDSLNSEGIYSERDFTVRVTHRYIKYMPANEAESDALQADTGLFFYDYPLDYEVVVQGNFYHDPAIPDSLPAPQYVVVPEGYTYNTAVAHEILEHLYIPEEDVMLLGVGLNENLEFGNLLLNGAHRHADQFFEPATPWDNTSGGSGGGNITLPDGRIRIFDNRLSRFIPLQGVEVTATRWFTTRSARTNSSGNYYLTGDPFQRPADYAIHFKSDPRFRIRNRHYFVDAKIVRNNIAGNTWNYDITDGTDRMHGTMFRAAYRYYYGNVGGLTRPIRPNGVQNIISKQRKNGGALNWIIFPNITIAQREDGMSGREYDCDEIFSATIHELAHTAHVISMNGAGDYAYVSQQIQESWCTRVEWFITRMEYQERGITNYMEWNYTPGTTYDDDIIQPIVHGFQFWNMGASEKYTSLFINLVDDFNENGIDLDLRPNFTLLGTVNDQVSGYNLATIQANYLKHMHAPSSLFNQLNSNRPAGVTTEQLSTLLSHY